MSKNDVNISINAQGSGARNQFASLVASLNRVEDSLRRISHTSAATARNTKRQFDGVQKSVLGAGRAMTTFLGIGSAGAVVMTTVQMLRAELDAIKQKMEGQKVQEISTGEAVARVHRQLPPGSDVTYDDIYAMATVNESGINPNEGADLLGAGLSSGEGPDARARLQGAADSFGLLEPYKQEDRISLIESSRAVADAFGGSAVDRAAQMLSALSASPSATQVGPFAENMSSAVVSLRSQGLSFEESLARFVTFQQSTRDTTGATSKTGVLQMEGQLKEEFTKHGIVDDIAPNDRLTFMQSDDPIANKIRKHMIGVYDRALSEAERAKTSAGSDVEAVGRAKNRIVNLSTERDLLQQRKMVDPTDKAHPQNRFFENRDKNLPSMELATETVMQRQAEARGSRAQAAYSLDVATRRFDRESKADPEGAARAQLVEFIKSQKLALGGTSLEGELESFIALLGNQDSSLDQVYGEFVAFLKDSRKDLATRSADPGTINPEGTAQGERDFWLDAISSGGLSQPGYTAGRVQAKAPDEYSERDQRVINSVDDMINTLNGMRAAFSEAYASDGVPRDMRQVETEALLRQVVGDDANAAAIQEAAANLWRVADGYPSEEVGDEGRTADIFARVVKRQLEKAMVRPLTDDEKGELSELSEVVGRGGGKGESMRSILKDFGAYFIDRPDVGVKPEVAALVEGREPPPQKADVTIYAPAVDLGNLKSLMGEQSDTPDPGRSPSETPKPKPADGASIHNALTNLIAAVNRQTEQMGRQTEQLLSAMGNRGGNTPPITAPRLDRSPAGQGIAIARPTRYSPPPIA